MKALVVQYVLMYRQHPSSSTNNKPCLRLSQARYDRPHHGMKPYALNDQRTYEQSVTRSETKVQYRHAWPGQSARSCPRIEISVACHPFLACPPVDRSPLLKAFRDRSSSSPVNNHSPLLKAFLESTVDNRSPVLEALLFFIPVPIGRHPFPPSTAVEAIPGL